MNVLNIKEKDILQFLIKNKERFVTSKEDYTKTAVSKGDDRLVFILNKLLFEQVPVLFDDLADELYVSRSTLSHDFRKIRVMLSEYNLSIESRANKGVYVSGE
ncbi:helix-turn-helix domain-containing protein, partial [Streptococcus pneumoniae]|uniref:helix-turn-helix domain-containing protein n=1 Tax=Streptococcus pneumoniae TaxID=1313 RepID=UPI001885A4AD